MEAVGIGWTLELQCTMGNDIMTYPGNIVSPLRTGTILHYIYTINSALYNEKIMNSDFVHWEQ